MKTILILASITAILLTLTACGRNGNDETDIYTPDPIITLPPDDEPEEAEEAEDFNLYVNGSGFDVALHELLGIGYFRAADLSRALYGTDWHFTLPDASPAEPDEIRLALASVTVGGEPVYALALFVDGEPYFSPDTLGRVLGISAESDGDGVFHIAPYIPQEEIPSITRLYANGYEIDTWLLSLDGTAQHFPLDGVLRGGRMYIDAALFTLALGLPMSESAEKHIFDLTEEYGLFAYFHIINGTIEFFSGHERPERLPMAGERDAFIRLEDVIVSRSHRHNHNLLRRRVLSDLLYKNNAAFTIAWVPVNVRPLDDFRSDTRDYNRYHLEFVFTMDYWISRGGQMGLHGYTHQQGIQNSVAGYDFGANVSDEQTRYLMQRQVAAAEYFGWTPYSFTFPKYIGTTRQYEIAGEYFDFILPNFHSRGSNNPNRVQIGDRQVIYMNAVEDHLVAQGETPLLELLGRLNRAGEIASFFFHTWLEYPYITIARDDENRPVITHDTNSPMHRILDNLRENGRVLRRTTHFFE